MGIILIYFAVGFSIGVPHFLGLLYAIKKLPSVKRKKTFLLGTQAVRLALLFAVLFPVAYYNKENGFSVLLSCLAGLWTGRYVVTKFGNFRQEREEVKHV